MLALLAFAQACGAGVLEPDGFHVYPGDNIQDALQQAAANPTNKVVKVHAGEYRPAGKRQALIWFNRAHDGIHLEAVGPVTLTAANPQLTTPRAQGCPAVVNHVVYFGWHFIQYNTSRISDHGREQLCERQVNSADGARYHRA